MAQNYRNQSGRSDYGRGGRPQTGGDQDRYRGSGEQRFNADDDRNRWQGSGFEGDRSYSGSHSEGFGYREGGNRDDQDRNWQGQQSRGASGADYRGGRGYGSSGNEAQSHFDEGNRWSEGGGGRELEDENVFTRDRGTTTSNWHEDLCDHGGYFNTGNYIDDGDSWRGFGRDFERARQQVRQRYGTGGSSGNAGRSYKTGEASKYAGGYYGSQSGYGRNDDRQQQDRSWSGQQPSGRSRQQYGRSNFGPSRRDDGSSNFGRSAGYEDRSSWNYGDEGRGAQRAGSGSSGGAYAFEPSYRSDFSSYQGGESQSHRGRGPQGYQRSDDRLKELICERLTDDPHIDASNVSVDVTGQIVKLTGTVDDRSTKYEIEELIESLGGVKDIDNQLRVQSRHSSPGQSSSNQSASNQQGRASEWEAGQSSSNSTSGSATNTRSGGTTSGSSGAGSTSASGSTSSSKRN